MEKVDEFCTRFGLDQFGEVPAVKKASEMSGLKHQHIILILASLLALGCLSRSGQWLVGILFTFLWPMYMSFKALESPGAQDDKKWLTYWVVFGFNYCFEDLIFRLLFFVPLIRLVRTALLVFLFASENNGSEWLFDVYVRHAFTFIKENFGEAIETAEEILRFRRTKIE